MKRFLAILLCCGALLTSCGAAPAPLNASEPEPKLTAVPAPSEPSILVSRTARLVAAEDDRLLLAYADGETAWLPVPESFTVDGKTAAVSWTPGMLLDVYTDGSLNVKTDGFNDLCALYLQVLEDLWSRDPALGSGIRYIGFDLTQTSLTPSERTAVAARFSALHNGEPLEATWEELADQGYIDQENLCWEDGCLLTIQETSADDSALVFDARNWRSGLGAYFFVDCTTYRSPNGQWEPYEINAEAIS